MKKQHATLLLPLITVAAIHALYTWYFSPSLLLHLAAALCDIAFVALWVLSGVSPLIKKHDGMEIQVDGISKESLMSAIAEGTKKKDELLALGKAISDNRVKDVVSDIAETVRDILDDINKDPKDLKLAKKFLSYYLDTTIAICKRYIDLSAQKTRSVEMKIALDKAEKTLDKMRSAFRQQLSRLLEDDVLDLNTELELLDKTIKAEGYGDEKLS